MNQERGARVDITFWRNRRVLVTGGTGFIGSHLVEDLVKAGARVRVVGRLMKSSLASLGAVKDEIEFERRDLSALDQCVAACAGQNVVMNLAAKLTGIGYNVKHPANMFYANVLPALQMLEGARLQNVESFLVVSSACVYPREALVPTPETEGFRADPEPTNFGYGWAKRVAEVQAQAYAKEYPMKIAIVRPFNAFGPRDDFEWETSPVIPALIRKIHEHPQLTVWGDGSQKRSFIHARDVARGMMLAVERAGGIEPLNLGSTELIALRDLIDLVCDLSGKHPPVTFDTAQPAGQDIRLPDMSQTQARLGFEAGIDLRTGLQETIEWYRAHLAPAAPPAHT